MTWIERTAYPRLPRAEPSGGRRQPDKATRFTPVGGSLVTVSPSVRTSEPQARSQQRRRNERGCPSCGREPTTRDEAMRQREDLAVAWLHLDGAVVTEARHCAACQPHERIIDIACSGSGDGPLITGHSELGDHLPAPALDWLHARGWQLHPRPLCPDHQRQQTASIKSP